MARRRAVIRVRWQLRPQLRHSPGRPGVKLDASLQSCTLHRTLSSVFELWTEQDRRWGKPPVLLGQCELLQSTGH